MVADSIINLGRCYYALERPFAAFAEDGFQVRLCP
jgi:hypothetical protein